MLIAGATAGLGLLLASCTGGPASGESESEGVSGPSSGASAPLTGTGGSESTGSTGGTDGTATEGTATDGTATDGTGSTVTSGPTTTASSTETDGDTESTGDTGGPTDPPPAACDGIAPVDVGGATVVGDGAPASCTGEALADAVAGGGVITFDCGGAHTITLDAALPITSDTVIDGGDQITLQGSGGDRLIVVETDNFEALTPHLTVQRIELRGGRSKGTAIPLGVDTDGGGGAIYLHGGSATVIDARFSDNACPEEGPDLGGGAIYGVGAGSITVSGSTFTDNRCANGGALGALGMDLSVTNSRIEGNEATGFGANYVENGVQKGRGGNGGGIVMDGKGKSLELCGVELIGNTSGAFGGGVFRTSYESEPTTITRSTIADNQAKDREDDLPSGAGALYLQGSTVTITATTVSGNQARSSSGVWILGHGPAPAIANLTNVTIAGNATWPRDPFTDRGLGGGLTIGDNTSGELVNCTIADNAAQFASGIARASTLTIRNTIIANLADNQYTPLNCTGTSYAMPSAMGQANIQWPNGLKDDMDCTPAILREDPLLGDLADNGGPTLTMMPSDASPALEGGLNCPPTDQRGQPRGEVCTVGAIEVPS